MRTGPFLPARFDTSDCVLACYSGRGFEDGIQGAGHRVALIGLADLYR